MYIYIYIHMLICAHVYTYVHIYIYTHVIYNTYNDRLGRSRCGPLPVRVVNHDAIETLQHFSFIQQL